MASTPLTVTTPTPEAELRGSVRFLREAAHYFAARPTGGEDGAHWANVSNAEKCRKIADAIERL